MTLTVVYVPSGRAPRSGIRAKAPRRADRTSSSLLIALDSENAKGGSVLTARADWIFTNEPIVEHEGVEYRFDQELKPGEFYACVIGADGSDVTDAANPAHVRPTHADFATMAPADSVEVVGAATGFAALAEFLGGIDLSPLWVTLKTTLTAIVFIFVLGLAAAYFSLRIPARAQDIADSIFTIPMVLPPTVCGFLLLLAFGKNTGVGQWFIDIGFPLIFSWQATVIAAVVVAFPLMYRSARGAFENLDPNMLDAARTLGWSNAKIFFKLMLPLSWSSIAAGTVLSFARALGEFGATLFLAGNYLGITRTIPIAIYFEWMNGNTDVAIFWTIVIMAVQLRGHPVYQPLGPAHDEVPQEGRGMSLEVNITKKYPSFTLDVAFTAGDETLGFLGASGCGKSLTMRCIAGIETPDEGRIVVNDQVFFDSAQTQ